MSHIKSLLRFTWYLIVPFCLSWYLFQELFINLLFHYPSLLFICLAAIYNAIMDSIENEHIVDTVFRGQNPDFWNKRISWAKATKVFGYKLDAWHLSKSMMIILLVLAIVFYTPMIVWYWDVLIFGYLWNLMFNGFYNIVFSRKK